MSSDPSASPSPPHYRAVSLWAVLSLICAMGTVAMFFGWWPGLLPLAAIYFGRKALAQIRRLPEEYTGKTLAQIGIRLAVSLGLVFSVWLWMGGKEVPYGYRVLEYSELEPDPNDKTGNAPPGAQDLSDKKAKVYVRGFILPPPRGRIMGLTKFSICRNSDMCKFQPIMGAKAARPCDEIHVEMTGDKTIDYNSYQIGVGGIFKVDKEQGPQPYYVIQADYTYP